MELAPQQPGSRTPVAAVIPTVTPVIAAVLPTVAAIIAPVTTPLASSEQAGSVFSVFEQSHSSCSFDCVLTIGFDRGDERLGRDPAIGEQLPS